MTTNLSSPRQWLIVRQGAVGDTILLSSVIQVIRQNEPDAWIEAMGVLERVELLTGEGMADAASSSERPGMETLYAEDADIPASLIEYFQRFDTILFYTGGSVERLARRIPIRPGAVLRVYPALPSPQEGRHCVEHYLGILHGLAAWDTVPIPRITLGSEELQEAETFLRSRGIDRTREFVLVLHPGASSVSKQAPADLFAQFAALLHRGIQTVCPIICGPADKRAVSTLQPLLPSGMKTTVLSEMPLRKLAAILHLSHLTIGNDSGIAHLAAAVDCPTLAVFTQSDPAVWSPMGSHVKTVVYGF